MFGTFMFLFSASSELQRPVEISSRALLEAKLVASGVLREGQHISSNQFYRILDYMEAQSKTQQVEQPRGLWRANGDYIPPEQVNDYFKKIREAVPGHVRA